MRLTQNTNLHYLNANTVGPVDSGTPIGPDPGTGVVPAQATSFNSAPMYVRHALGYVIQVSNPSTGSPVGSWKLQCCSDLTRTCDDIADTNLVNWTDLDFPTGSGVVTFAVSGAATTTFSDTACFYPWVRLVWTAGSGSISPTAVICLKGISA